MTALNMQLKNHPLKDENAVLVKRLQEEQDKHRIEIKRYKNKLHEQTAKADKAISAAAHATAAATAAAVAEKNSVPIVPVIAANAEVQTDDELTACLQKLQGKYNDLKNICRFRLNIIKDLEAKVTQKENTDGNSLSVLEAAQYKVVTVSFYKMEKSITFCLFDTFVCLLFSRINANH